MYRITRTIFICKDGSKKQSHDTVDVADLELYRASIRKPMHARINFVYQTIDDDEYNRENRAD